MTEDRYVIGLRLDPDQPEPQLYAQWYEDQHGEDRVRTRQGRIVWVLPPATGYELVTVADVAALLHDLREPSEADGQAMLTTIDALDEFLKAVGYALGSTQKAALNQLAKGLFEEIPPAQLLAEVPADLLVDAVLSSLGIILCFSNFK